MAVTDRARKHRLNCRYVVLLCSISVSATRGGEDNLVESTLVPYPISNVSSALHEEHRMEQSSMFSPQMLRGRGMDIGFAAGRQRDSSNEDSFKRVKTAVSKAKNLQNDAFQPGMPWLDTDGDLIQAHGGGVLYHDGMYYWFGEHKGGTTYIRHTDAYSPPRVDVIGVSCYSSADLLHWKNEGLALRARTHPDLDVANVLERPKVIYDRKHNQFVMWMHVDTGDYELASVGMATADKVTGPYTYLHSLRPHNQQARDFTVFQDDDDSGYIAYSSEDNAVMHIARLTQDYLGIEPEYKRILVYLKREAPALFKYKQYYLLLTSGCTGWAPNRAEIFYSVDVMGEWKTLGNPSAGSTETDRARTFFSQPSFVVPVTGKPGKFVFMADQWDTSDLGESRYVWLPMFVEEVQEDVLATVTAQWQNEKELHLRRGGSSFYTSPPGPLHVIVQWLDSWAPEILDEPLDSKTREDHWQELRTYPLAGKDIGLSEA